MILYCNTNTCSIANPLATKDSMITLESVNFHASVSEDKQSTFLPPHTESSKVEATDSQSIKLPTDSDIANELHSSATNGEVSVSSCSESVDETSKCGSLATYTSSLDKRETTGT